jgi:UDP-glucose 4-epimerase
MSPWKYQIGEEITDVAKVSNINAILLRYFNPIGATSSEIENYLLSTSKLGAVYYANRFGLRTELSVYGDDYPTPDGTAYVIIFT